jgi:hypothetical protein
MVDETTTLTQRLATAAKETQPGSLGALAGYVAWAVAAWGLLGPFAKDLFSWLRSPDGRKFALFVTNWSGDHPHTTARIVLGIPLVLVLFYVLKFGIVPAVKSHWPMREMRPFWAEVVLGVFSPSDHATWAIADKKTSDKAAQSLGLDPSKT